MTQPETAQLIADLQAVVRDAEALLKATASQAGEKAQEARERAEQSLRQARQRLSEFPGAVRHGAKQATQTAEDYVRENPWQSLGIAAGVGMILGLLLRQRD